MSVGYTAVQWNRQKRIYDLWLGILLAITVGVFAGVSVATHPRITAETLILRSSALAALVLLHVILCIGPLARLDRRFLPLLYNRRHLGVTMFALALIHAALAVFQFHAFGVANPVTSALTAYRRDYSPWADGGFHPAHVPFEVFGFAALVVLFLMAATSHDFWLRNLGASFWKTLHLAVLVAYGALVLHVALGVLQSETSPLYPLVLGLGLALILGLHLAAAWQEKHKDEETASPAAEGYEPACPLAELEEGRGKVVVVGGERRALFLHEGKVFALSNVCRHQGGPLGEGRIVDGVVTCPWHGWQYRPHDGCSPPPFEEVVPTYRVRVADGTVWMHPEPLPLASESCGVDAVAAAETAGASAKGTEDFYIGYLPEGPPALARHTRRAVTVLALALPVLAAAVAWAQGSFDRGVFEFGVERSFEGVLYETPVPMLRVTGPAAAAAPGAARLLLVGSGKHHLPEVARGHHGEKVAFDGSLIYRRGLTMIEMNAPETFRVLGPPEPGEGDGPVEMLGSVQLEGELVDTKCFSGVMRPGAGKVHRGCASLCLRGGIPPGLLVRGDGEGDVVVILAGRDGAPLDFDVEWAARTVRATGELELLDGVPVLRVVDLELVIDG